MNINIPFLKQAGIFILFLLGFWVISAVYLKPAFDDKVLKQGDMQQVRMMRYEADEYKKEHGSYPGWIDGLFSGMPTSLITGVPTGNIISKSGMVELFHMVKSPLNFLFVAMVGMFVLLLAADINRWLAAAGAIGYAFMTFSITSFEAGHITKVLAMDVMPGVLAGLLLISKKKYLWGAAVAGVFFTILVGYFHYQIAYYIAIVAGIFVLIEIIKALRNQETKHALYMAVISILVLAAGAMANLGKMVDTAQYAEATMRGGSEVASELPKQGPKQQVAKKGLERDYAFAWSYGIEESYTLLVPRFMGGSSRENIGENELSGEEPLQGLYWGDLQFTSGPVYIGAIFIFLFALGIVTVLGLKKLRPDNPGNAWATSIMWFSIITTAISLFLAWGRYFPVNDFLFDYLPYYNKFRTPMMAFAIAQVIVPFFGLYGLQLLLNAGLEKQEMRTILKRSAIAIGALLGLGILMLLFSDFSGAVDKELRGAGYQGDTMEKLKDIRRSEAWGDWFRSFIFIGLSFLLVGYTALQKKGNILLYIGLILLISIDMIGVSKRYLNESNWDDKEAEEAIQPTPKDAGLMRINKDHSRVFDLRYNPFNDAHSAPWHRSIGGYHPAKLSRYQDIISYAITPNGGSLSFDGLMKNNALDMLNCKYILSTGGKDNRQEEVIPRPAPLGNAWFVKTVITVPTAKKAIETINNFHPGNEAVVEAKETAKPASETYTKDSNSSIVITSYDLDTIKYLSKNSGNGLGVFSEIYYNQKNGAWKAYIDGKPATVLRVNYILRGLEIPAGEHKIEFIFSPLANRFLALETASSSLLLLLLIVAVGMNLLGGKKPAKENA